VLHTISSDYSAIRHRATIDGDTPGPVGTNMLAPMDSLDWNARYDSSARRQ